MSIDELDFSQYPYLSNASACGRVSISDGLWVPDENVHLESKIDCEIPYRVRLLVNKQERPPGVHFHIDLAREQFVNKPLKNPVPIADLRDTLGRYLGQEIYLLPKARFRIPVDQIPSDGIVSALLTIKTIRNDLLIQLSGSRFSIDRGPVKQVEWNKDEEEIEAIVRGELETTVEESYVQKSLAIMSDACQSLLLSHSVEKHAE